MAIDPFDEETRVRPAARIEAGQDLSTLSIDEIDERIARLEHEIARLRETKRGKENSRAAASAFFKIGSA